MEMPKQMSAGETQPRARKQQGQSEDMPERRKTESDVARSAGEQMQATHFSDWASI
ncbi:hypothetical protein [Defluviimonas sp. SAOS-178_SWC]|uniref:hypothetical protein n=1 Tax=Defluviimonas sp. SAOS-178_SWC TaxID=3121287 RepID=UPI003221A3F9